jgi:hypothetical protein
MLILTGLCDGIGIRDSSKLIPKEETIHSVPQDAKSREKTQIIEFRKDQTTRQHQKEDLNLTKNEV